MFVLPVFALALSRNVPEYQDGSGVAHPDPVGKSPMFARGPKKNPTHWPTVTLFRVSLMPIF